MIDHLFLKYSLYILTFGCIYILLIKKNSRNIQYAENSRRSSLHIMIAAVCVCLLLGYLVQLLVSGILQVIRFINPQLLETYSQWTTDTFYAQDTILRLIAVMLLAPIGEELLFRGILLHLSIRFLHFNRIFSICLTGILFGLCHGQTIQVLYAIPAGILLGLIAEGFHSILPAICFHMAVNTGAYLLPVFLFQTKETAILLTAVSFIFISVCCYVLFCLSDRLNKISG